MIDDQPVCHAGLQRLLRESQEFELCPLATSIEEALLTAGVDLVIFDISAARNKGVSAVKEIKTRFPRALILVLTGHDEVLFAERCLKLGASGYAMKTAKPEHILEAIRDTANGSLHVSEHIKSLVLRRLSNPRASEEGSSFDKLSDRELLIVQQIGLSKNNKEIAKDLQISVKTIESHRSRIKAKLNLGSTQDLMRYAMRLTNPTKTG